MEMAIAVVKRTTMLFTLIIVVMLGFLYSIGDVIAPFAVGMLFAYFCAPIVNKLEHLKFSRQVASIIVLCGIGIIIILFSVIVIPLLYKQILLLAYAAMDHRAEINQLITSITTDNQYIPSNLIAGLQSSFSEISSKILSFSGNLISRALQSSIAAVNVITMLFVMPIVIYYFLADWPKIVNMVDSLVPRRMRKNYFAIKRDLDNALSNYIRGQSLVCTIMGIMYALALSAIGVESGFALGIISGILTFIPYVGALFSVCLSCLIVAVQYTSISKVLMVIVIFCVGQFIENNFIVPKFIGNSLHLHPVWIIFGLLAGGALLGFLGMLLALPLTAVIAVIIRYLIKEYKKSLIYSS